ncbi:hypothetical protein C5167_029163 [Papaver somniferum]|nr:hypothetical protein C5167_029163 [Papaver somniferum]
MTLVYISCNSLRTTLCVRFKSEVVACGVVYAAARRFQFPLPENPPWWKAFDAEKSGIDEVCRVLAHLYSRPKAQYIPVCKTGDSSTPSNKSWDTQAQQNPKEGSANGPAAGSTVKGESALASNLESGGSKDLLVKVSLDKMKEKGDDDVNSAPHEGETSLKPKVEQRIEGSGERSRERERERIKPRDSDRGRDFDREREREKVERESRDKLKERSRRSKDRGKDSGLHLSFISEATLRNQDITRLVTAGTTTAPRIHPGIRIDTDTIHMLELRVAF